MLFLVFKFIVGCITLTVTALSLLPFFRLCVVICVVFMYFDGR